MKLIKTTSFILTQEGVKQLLQEKQFDQNENVIVQIDYQENGQILISRSMNYDSVGNLINDRMIVDQGTSQTTDYQYDTRHRIAQQITNYGNEEYIRVEFEYTPDKTIQISYDAHNNIEQIIVEEFNPDMLPISRTIFNSTNEVEEQSLYEYNDQLLKIKEIEHRIGQDQFIQEFKYDENNHLITLEKWKDQTQIIKEQHTYKNGLLHSKTVVDFTTARDKEETTTCWFYTYDAQQRLIKEQQQNTSGNLLTSWVNVFDNEGNLERTHYVKSGYFNAIYGTGSMMEQIETLYINEYEKTQ